MEAQLRYKGNKPKCGMSLHFAKKGRKEGQQRVRCCESRSVSLQYARKDLGRIAASVSRASSSRM